MPVLKGITAAIAYDLRVFLFNGISEVARTLRVNQGSDGVEDGHFPVRGKSHRIAVKMHNKALFHRCIS